MNKLSSVLKGYLTGAYFQKKMVYNAQNGPSRYILKNLEQIHSVKALGLAFEAEEHRLMLDPVRLELKRFKKLLILAPHTDDEVIGCGGLLIKARDMGLPAEVFFTTNSESNFEEQTAQRKRECERVMNRLNINCSFSEISNINLEANPEDIYFLRSKIFESKADAVFFPWLFDYPVKHRFTNLLLYLALKDQPQLQALQYYGYQVHNTPLVNCYLDISDVMDEKYALIKLYQSQVSKVAYADFARAMNLLNTKFVGHVNSLKYYEVFHGISGDELKRWVSNYYLKDLPALFRYSKNIIKQAEKIIKSC